MPGTKLLALADTRALAPREFEQICRLAYDTCGIDLKPGKEDLVSARLRKLVIQAGLHSFGDYYHHVCADSSGEALAGMIDALTTNHTAFMRESAHYRFLSEKVLPDLKPRGRADVWCAASATGEEAWTLAFLLADRGLAGDGCVLATDISRRALRVASVGAYTKDRCQLLPLNWRQRYLAPGLGERAGWIQVRPEVKRWVEFRQVNLIRPFHFSHGFAAIFCRNVMIYFDKATQQTLVNRMAGCLEPGGYLFVGHAESLAGASGALQYVCPAVYRKAGGRR